eukprot:1953424-Alexandrium_andersonii.AAC.1
MEYCSGSCSGKRPRPISGAKSALPAPNAGMRCTAGLEMLNTSPLCGCRSSSTRGRSTPTASKW